MAYCVLADITAKRIPEATLIQLTDDQDTGAVDQTVVDGIIADADELIDGHLRGRYVLPLEPVPGMVKALSVDIAVYNLYGRRSEYETPKGVAEKYAAAMKILEKIRKGEIALGTAGVIAPEAETPAETVLVSTGDQMFSKDTLDRY
jgi:phage gp36-like protein